MNTVILVCCHKQDIYENKVPYLPIQVGKALSSAELGIQPDNEGDNISEKNGSYCELTGMYWAWKNLNDVDVIGLCHYRRYFDFNRQCHNWAPYTVLSTDKFEQLNRDIPERVLSQVASGQVVVTKPTNCQFNLMVDYCCYHNSDDFKVLQHVIMTTQPENIRKAFYKVMYGSNRKYTYNMFIMRWADFDAYCTWLFPILADVERAIDITHYNAIQKRIFGYMSERLFNIWLLANGKKLIRKPVMWFTDQQDGMTEYNVIKYWIRCIFNDCSRLLGQPRYKNVMR